MSRKSVTAKEMSIIKFLKENNRKEVKESLIQ